MRSSPTLRRPVAVLLLAMLCAGASLTTSAHAAGPTALKAGVFNPPYMAPDFSLRGTGGLDVTLGRYRGKVVLLTFGYTHCAAVCPTTMATLAQTRSALGKAADSVQVIYVTVDPERDDIAHMRTFLAAFDPTFVGLTGAHGALAAVRQKYGVTAVRHGAGRDYVMAHTSSIYLIDRAGRLRAMMPFGHEPADYVHDVKLLLAQ